MDGPLGMYFGTATIEPHRQQYLRPKAKPSLMTLRTGCGGNYTWGSTAGPISTFQPFNRSAETFTTNSRIHLRTGRSRRQDRGSDNDTIVTIS